MAVVATGEPFRRETLKQSTRGQWAEIDSEWSWHGAALSSLSVAFYRRTLPSSLCFSPPAIQFAVMSRRQPRRPFSLARYIAATLRHRPAVTIAVALGVATATTVITGALVVGDSMRGSLRGLTIQRLGRIESVVAPGQFFPVGPVRSQLESSVPIILFPGATVETDQRSPQRRIGGVQVVAADEEFWDLDVSGTRPEQMPGENSVVLNAAAAAELNVQVGDLVTLRLPVEGAVPADSPLGRRELQSEGLPRLRVADVVPDVGLGRFSLMPNQASPMTVFAARKTIAEVLDREGQANVLLSDERLASDAVPLTLSTLGWKLEHIQRGQSIDYVSLTSDSLLLPEAAVSSIAQAFRDNQVTPVLAYLANVIERADVPSTPADARSTVPEEQPEREIHPVPYSILAAIDDGPTLPLDYRRAGPDDSARSAEPSLSQPVPMVIHSWTAERLGAEIGTPLQVAYYEPEVERGREVERTFPAVVSDIVPLTQPSRAYRRNRPAEYDQPLTPYNDPNLTPEVPGVTDQASISDWDLPFPLTRRIDREDDEYWNNYRLTPKAYLPLEVGQRLFGSRFGQTTGLRFSPDVLPEKAGDPEEAMDLLAEQIVAAIEPARAELGWVPRPIRQQQLAASQGTTPFDGLFLALSMFVIFSAVMLIALLLRLGMMQRFREFGTLLAVGWPPARVMRLAMGETAAIGAIGAVLGVAGGIGYAGFVLWALRSWWIGAVTVPFLQFHATATSFVLGAAIGWLVCMLTAWWSLRFLWNIDPATLLGGRRIDVPTATSAAGRVRRWFADGRARWWIVAALLLVAVLVAATGATAGGQEAAGGFIGGGMLLLIAALVAVDTKLRSRNRLRPSLTSLAIGGARRNPLRSTLAIGLVATASFLILSMSAFRMSPDSKGTGGFDLIGQTAQPIHQDLSDPAVQRLLLGSDAERLEGVTTLAWRMRSGQDASCNNLYQATQPTVLGITAGAMPDSFGWAGSAADAPGATWRLLDKAAAGTTDDPIPVILDQNTAMWSLQMRGGVGEIKTFAYDEKPLAFQVVGLLAGSVLQGKLLIGEDNFTRAFPDQTGYQYFLFDLNGAAEEADDVREATAEPGRVDSIAEALESRLSDAGMDISNAENILAGLLAVQNTYLRTFQSLGGLGLLLGTIGLAVAQLRSVLQRRGELAVMRAIGFTRIRLAGIVLGENLFLLTTGIGCGIATAALAVGPYASLTDTDVPVWEPLLLLLVIFGFGLLAGLLAVLRVSTLPLVESLRAEDVAIEL